MSCPSRMTRPLTRAPGTVSCIRLRQRRKVDLPHPDGPMTAVTVRSVRSTDTPRTACTTPKNASRRSMAMRVDGAGTATGAARSVAGAEAASRDDTCGKADDEDDGDEDECARPGLRNPVVVWGNGIREDLQGERRDRRLERCRPEGVA